MKNKVYRQIFWVYLLFLLIGYMFFDKGFAYFGIYPVYVSEIGLIIGGGSILILFKDELYWKRLAQPPIILLFVFIVWQFFRTAPFLLEYRFDALRDAVLWGYAFYTIFILILFKKEHFRSFLSYYVYVIPFYLGWIIIARILVVSYNIAPILFNAPASIFAIKAGDVGVHLAGIAAFMLILDDGFHSRPRWYAYLIWGLWWVSWVIYCSFNRGGMLSALVGILVTLLLGILKKVKLNWKPILPTAFLIIGLFSVSNSVYYMALNNRISSLLSLSKNGLQQIFGDNDQQVLEDNDQQVLEDNDQQVLEDNDQQVLEDNDQQILLSKVYRAGTINWRLSWWEKIVGYTFDGQFFWDGKGYGINLADEDGFQTKMDHSVRSPHNATMTILARSGVPGFAFWIVFLFAFSIKLLKSFFGKDNEQHNEQHNVRIVGWLFAYWLAFLVNSSFDVYLEGPMGGVWFWSLTGAAMFVTIQPTRKHKV